MESRDCAETAASAWIARWERDDWSAADEAQFAAWMEAAIDNRVAWLRLSTAWRQTDRLKSVITTGKVAAVPTPAEMRLPFFDSEKEGVKPARLPRSRAKVARALAAGVLIAIAAAVTWYLAPRGPYYHTEIGAIEAVPLSDGSVVTLNTKTAIRVNVTPTERRVSLTQGEAYFEVAKDPARPFVVRAGDKRIVAVGTSFSVRREDDEVRVFVTEGKVRVEQGRGVGEETSPGGRRGATLLAAGNVARATDDGVLVQERSVAEVEQLLSWRTGRLVFEKTPLAEAVAEFNRYSARKIVIQDPAVATIRVGGNFRATNAEGFVRLIASDFPINVTQQKEAIILTGAPPR